jgi:BA14K-like protein
MKQSVFIYCSLSVIVLGSVLFGLDWQPATLSPMAPIPVVALPPPPLPAPVKAAAPVAAPKRAVAATPQIPSIPPLIPVAPKRAAPVQAPPASVANENPATPATENAAPPVVQTPPKPLCDVAACAAAYRSFRESDCTFNPSFGPRQLCTKGVVPTEATTAPAAPAPPAALDAPASIMQDEPNARTNAQPAPQSNTKCNVSACAAAYHSFTESDCTFMATGGLRKLCTK